MKTSKLCAKITAFIIANLTATAIFAGVPPLSINLISPNPLPTELSINASLPLNYSVTNNTGYIMTLTVLPIAGLSTTFAHTNHNGIDSCSYPVFTLTPGSSCNLSLILTGANIDAKISGGPVICRLNGDSIPELRYPVPHDPDMFFCVQPNTNSDILNITKCRPYDCASTQHNLIPSTLPICEQAVGFTC